MCAKFLVISDIHGSLKSLNKVRAAYHKYEPDFSVICGDITHFGSKEDAVDILEKIPTEIIGITGNCDKRGVEQAYPETDNRYIELKMVEKKGIDFIGLSGSKYSEEKVRTFKERAVGADVLVFHQPPYGYLDEASRGKHIGSKKLVSVVEELKPKLVLSGHVHEDRGTIREKGTVYMNPGPAGDDKLGFVEIEGEKVNAQLI
ncbi:MAG: metallophosphoesterase family protein [Candidatus Thermoplasmatota archaeon]|nr:metallophosphoesterase family protein [Candidatus Thermoplasmatota archaeon]